MNVIIDLCKLYVLAETLRLRNYRFHINELMYNEVTAQRPCLDKAMDSVHAPSFSPLRLTPSP